MFRAGIAPERTPRRQSPPRNPPPRRPIAESISATSVIRMGPAIRQCSSPGSVASTCRTTHRAATAALNGSAIRRAAGGRVGSSSNTSRDSAADGKNHALIVPCSTRRRHRSHVAAPEARAPQEGKTGQANYDRGRTRRGRDRLTARPEHPLPRTKRGPARHSSSREITVRTFDIRPSRCPFGQSARSIRKYPLRKALLREGRRSSSRTPPPPG